MSDGSHLSDLDLDIQSQSSPNDALNALWSNGHTMFVLDRFDDRVYAYSMSDSSRDSAREISLVSANGNAEGMWFDGRVLWVSDYTDDYLYAYHLPGATSSVTLWEDTSLSTSEHTANTRYDADLGEPKPTFVVDGVRYTLDSIRQLHSPPRSPKLAMTIKPLVPSSERSALGFVSDGMEYSPSDVDQFINSAAATEIVWIIPSITWIKGGTTSAALRLYGNTPAEGNVVIGGVPELGGGALEADVSGITDAEGLSADAFHYQWVRVTGITVVDLPGADDSTYTPSKADEYSKLQVRVVFNDLAGFQEYPKTSALVGPPAGCGNDTCRLLTATRVSTCMLLIPPPACGPTAARCGWATTAPRRWCAATACTTTPTPQTRTSTAPATRVRTCPASLKKTITSPATATTCTPLNFLPGPPAQTTRGCMPGTCPTSPGPRAGTSNSEKTESRSRSF